MRVLMLGFILLLAACSAGPNGGGGNTLAGTSWQLVELSGTTPIANATVPTLVFRADNKIGGNSSCNSFGGTYQASATSLTLSDMMSTLMACEPPVMDQESRYVTALATVTSYAITGNELWLKNGTGQIVMRFTRM